MCSYLSNVRRPRPEHRHMPAFSPSRIAASHCLPVVDFSSDHTVFNLKRHYLTSGWVGPSTLTMLAPGCSISIDGAPRSG